MPVPLASRHGLSHGSLVGRPFGHDAKEIGSGTLQVRPAQEKNGTKSG
jgi:hypothetical protein